MTALYVTDAFERLELLTLDYRFLFRQPKQISPEIVFIDMAEDSIDFIGRWPWPRRWHAVVVKILSDYGAKLIAFDVLFSEPQGEEDDLSLEEAIIQARNVYLPVLYDFKEHDTKHLCDPGNIISMTASMESFGRNIAGTGHLNAIPDSDGVLRRVPPVITYKNDNVYQFGLKIGLDMKGVNGSDILFVPKRHVILFRSSGVAKRIPLDNDNQLIVNWKNRWGGEGKHYSYIDVIKSYASIKAGKKPLIDLNEFKDKICVIGLTATGLIDIKPIPLERAYPAVGINVMIIDSVLKDDYIYEVPRVIDFMLIILLSALITLYLTNIRLLGGILLALISMVGYVVFSIILFRFFNVAILTFYPLLAIFLSYSVTSVYNQVAQTIERTRLFKQATRDELTSLYNIRHFNVLLESEFRHASTYKSRRLALIMGDIDNFKHANDTFGHPAGDIILREAAAIIKSKCRQIDVAARYGGEEFIIMLTGAGSKEAGDVAEKIRAAVEEKKFEFGGQIYGTTISLGIAQFSGERNKEELIAKADKALYQAKRDGKNRVRVHPA